MDKNILVVDDNLGVSMAFQALFESKGFNCSTSNSAKDAYLKLSEEKFDLVIIDHFMPNETGYDLICKIRENGIDLPIIVMSGSGTKELLVDLIHLDDVDYVDKPIAYDDFMPLLYKKLYMPCKKVYDEIAATDSKIQELVTEKIDEIIDFIRGGIEHEFNKPLTVVYGGLQLLKKVSEDGKVDSSVKQVVEFTVNDIEEAMISIQHLLNLLSNIKKVSLVKHTDVKIMSISESAKGE